MAASHFDDLVAAIKEVQETSTGPVMDDEGVSLLLLEVVLEIAQDATISTVTAKRAKKSSTQPWVEIQNDKAIVKNPG